MLFCRTKQIKKGPKLRLEFCRFGISGEVLDI
jgi:hypothetical protein